MNETPETQIEKSLSVLFRMAARLPERDRNTFLREVKKIKTAFGALAEEKETLQKHACIDPLTGIPNRRGIVMDFHGRLENMKRHRDSDLAICLIDLDGFKAVNDRCGHHRGDDALREVAMRLQSAFRQSDTVGRYGGDEMVLLFSCEKGEAFNADFVREKIRASLDGIVYWSGREPFPIAASIGFSYLAAEQVFDGMDAGGKLESLMMQADADMYIDKRKGKDQRLSDARQAARAGGKNGEAKLSTP